LEERKNSFNAIIGPNTIDEDYKMATIEEKNFITLVEKLGS
jgi:hypothetical protein